jgi:hypothetical protein
MKLHTNLRAGQTTGGGYVNGVYYPAMSGYCSGSTVTPTPPPPTTGGGYVNGVYYPDMSGYCSGAVPTPY